MVRTYCVTFGQLHPLRDNWVEVEAKDREEARRLVLARIGKHWASIYPKSEFNTEMFPGGRVGLTLKEGD